MRHAIAALSLTLAMAAEAQSACQHQITCGSSVTASLDFAAGTCLDSEIRRFDTYTFSGAVGETLTATLSSPFFAPALQLISPASVVVADDENPGHTSHAAVSFKFPTSGLWTLSVRNIDVGTGGQYTLTTSCAQQPGEPPSGLVVAMTPPTITADRGTSKTLHVSTAPVGSFSDQVTVTITSLPPAVTAQPSSATFPAPGGGAFDSTLSIGADAPGGTFVIAAVATSRSGGAVAGTTLKIDASCSPPFLLKQPTPPTITRGGMAALTVNPSGTPPFSFQWYLGASGSTGFPATHGTAADLVTPPLTGDQTFWVRVSNACGSVDSTAVNVRVLAPPARRRAVAH
jgi:hypothetical protein